MILVYKRLEDLVARLKRRADNNEGDSYKNGLSDGYQRSAELLEAEIQWLKGNA